MSEIIHLQIDLTDNEAWDYAQFLKRVSYSDYVNNAADSKEAHRMVQVGEKIRKALAEQGVSPR